MTNKSKHTISLRIPRNNFDKVSEDAKRLGVSINAVISLAIANYFEQKGASK